MDNEYKISVRGRLVEGLRWRGEVLKDKGWGCSWPGRRIVDALLLPSDIQTIRKQYLKQFGVTPRLIFSKTFNEKLQRSKLFHRPPRYIQYADKIHVRDFVRKQVGPEILNELIWSGVDLMAARSIRLPHQFIIKANNGSGTNIIVEDLATFDWGKACEQTRRWLKHCYADRFGEWQYRWITPRLLIEPLLKGPDGKLPLDYKFFCFHGKVEFIQVDVDRFTKHTRNMFDRDFNRLPVALKFPPYPGEVSKPTCLEDMIQIAEILSNREPFIRVDLYDCGRPVFGELTLHPEAGLGHFTPPEWDLRFGARW
jgi:hypothetical protein